MSDYDANQSDATSNDTLDNTAGGADNSIIGKVKSRVSNIFPNSLYKWFSPSTKSNDSINGNLRSSAVGVSNARRRRRLEVEEEEEDDEDEEDDAEEEEEDAADDEQIPGEYDENTLRHNRHNNTDEESNNSEEYTSITRTAAVTSITSRRTLSSSTVIREPPLKRSRFSLDITNKRSSPLTPRQPLLSSTPTVSNNVRSNTSHPTSLDMGRLPNRYTHLNLYGDQNKKEAAFNFRTAATTTVETVPNFEAISGGAFSSAASSRRSLNIPPSSYNARENYTSLANMKRPTLTSATGDLPSTSSGIVHEKGALPRRTSTTILELEPGIDTDIKGAVEDVGEGRVPEMTHFQPEPTKYNGRSSFMMNKRQRLINGTGMDDDAVISNTAGAGDSSASDSSEGIADGNAEGMADMPGCATMQRKTGLFNMSSANSHYGSRTSSFGNGLNFYSHLEGRKSLFSGAQGAAGANAMNSSTLSLTSLNRRQFNASIYGSTSALSDSRLLNTFSPFYKGRTTYGGAAAYNKYTASGAGTGVGASAVRITPTLIRPTSSLSTLSSSNNSLVAGSTGAAGGIGSEHATLSSTAKRILDLINDFATPLSEAKKMASNLKSNQQQHLLLPQAKARLNDTYLEQSRAMRLSQVRTPYMRPTVTLHPNTTQVNGQSNLQMPPVRELQVPSMSQLLKMKKLQNTTERSRQIARQNSTTTTQAGTSAEYTLPIAAEEASISNVNHRQQKHTNKIKHKVTTSSQITRSAKDADVDTLLPPVNLPDIAFPLMQSVPKIDITLPISTSASVSKSLSAVAVTTTAPGRDFKSGNAAGISTRTPTSPACSSSKSATIAANSALKPFSVSTESSPRSIFTANTSPIRSSPTADMKGTLVSTNFKFSAPLELKGLATPTVNITALNGNYKFSSPMLVSSVDASFIPTPKSPIATIASAPQLKTGSVLDALKKPRIVASTGASAATITTTNTAVVSGFGSQFKKSSSEWECEACMLRNKLSEIKCVACETPRKSEPLSSGIHAPGAECAPPAAALPLSSSFGSQFKKSADEWECDACMLRNKSELMKCVACETPRKGGTSVLTQLQPPPINSSFGDAFKPKANTWECSTCLIQNQSSANECVACQSKKPGTAGMAVSPTTTQAKSQFKFGFSAVKSTDEGFKALAAEQKVSKWECEACMTRNDSARLKCVCCDQAKPGSNTVGENVPKFSFGSTAATKFSFGFGVAAQAGSTATATTAKTIATTQKTDAQPKGGFVFGSGSSNAVKPTVVDPVKIKATASKDVADSKDGLTSAVVVSGFKFGASGSDPPAKGFVFGSAGAAEKSVEASSSSSSVVSSASSSSSSTSVKFSLPTTTAATTKTTETASSDPKKTSTFVFGSPSAATTSTSANLKLGGGFSFGTSSKPSDSAGKSTGADTPAFGGFAFKSPAAKSAGAGVDNTKSFSFGSPAGAALTAPANASPAAAVKSMFGFGSTTAASSGSITTTAASSTTSTTSTSTIAATSAGGFSFGGTVTPAATTNKPHFDTSISTTASVASSQVATIPTSAIGNEFGSFGNSAKSSGILGFGVAPKGPAAPETTTSSTTFGSFGAGAPSASSTSIFGQSGSAKPTASSTPLFSSTTRSGSTIAASSSSGSFVFGSGAAATPCSVPTSTAPTSTAATTWPQNSFAFGAVPVTAPATTAINTNPVFGGFGGAQSSSTNNSGAPQAASIFGNLAAATSVPNAFGSTGTSSGGSAPVFGSNSPLRSGNLAGSSSGIFGAASAAGNTNLTSPTFGAASAFGSNLTVAGATPTFGSAAGAAATAAPAVFGGFGASAVNTAAPDGASAAKRSEPAFNFGSTSAQNTTGGFNFSATTAAAKPGFNFGATSQPAFNFTGATEAQPTKPFQFGATPLPPVFNFSGGAAIAEATPNAPFQFNAGAAPASSNIFAPNPTPGAQSAQQVRRKIRAPIRRLTPR